MTERAKLFSDIEMQCKKFKFEEFEEYVLPIFPDVDGNDLVHMMRRYKKSVTASNVGKSLVQMLKTIAVDTDELRECLYELLLTDKVIHSNRFTWTACRMEGQRSKIDLMTTTNLLKKLKTSFRNLEYAPVLKAKFYNSLCWIMIIGKRKDRQFGYTLQKPLYLVYAIEEPYLICSHKITSPDIFSGLQETFGYRKIVKCSLSGKHVESLFQLLRNKTAQACSAKSVLYDPPEYKPGKGIETGSGTDFTRQNLKEKLSSAYFAENSPQLQALTVKEISSSDKPDRKTSLIFKSTDIASLMRNLMRAGIFVLPLSSPYISRFFTLGKNVVTLKPVNREIEGSCLSTEL